ncbi:nicotinate-nucleotide--dimethylbenzimidazole phosphoribosyltransferase [Thermodesulforhabdus norvegica]|uniref:Nicotinate-nucleotide--dimethylbenzimidazole phosphoribosyltransferase n=1 Tax=Thermodesulforhabdus norvegica TaxID=39841 RepID=A0A1I4VG16_9BACT|nr:nicotinate-nucleotide--dimethylbenzimidazole phosphoribosyltransferase [Thermodesulforhabdus norvegica]SFN00177.1 nicotinate-nucleotide-dimethylbenzimidazole phosphoribosyltransferase [Thermodesulforhabdus norvegica]
MRDLKELIFSIEPADASWEEKAWNRLKSQIRPRGSLGLLENIAARLAAIKRSLDIELSKKLIFTMAGDHGVAEEGVSAYPQEVTSQMVFAFIQGWASINVLARHGGIDVRVVDMGVASDLPEDWNIVRKKIRYGTANFTKGPAMTREEAEKGLLAGAELVVKAVKEEGYQLIGTGDMGIANTTPSSAILAVFSGRPVAEITGRGTGIDDQAFQKKVQAIERALSVNSPSPEDPIDVLAKVGGCEIAGLAGAVLGAAASKVPVVCDGFIATAGALIAVKLAPAAKDYLFISHRSGEPGHKVMSDILELPPILDLGMRLGEGTGAALAMPIVEAAAKVLKEIKTFEEAGVTDTGH